jgi:hypothetical protein
MKTEEIPQWKGLTDYRPPIFEEYEFDFSLEGNKTESYKTPPDDKAQRLAGLNYAREVVKDPCNSKWVERRKLTDAFDMGVEYAKRYLNCG